jgi:hypothetical protein
MPKKLLNIPGFSVLQLVGNFIEKQTLGLKV